jgi:hypothetical protein
LSHLSLILGPKLSSKKNYLGKFIPKLWSVSGSVSAQEKSEKVYICWENKGNSAQISLKMVKFLLNCVVHIQLFGQSCVNV